MKMSVNDAAEYFGVSKEAIHNRIRRGSLEAVMENGVKMVTIDESIAAATKKTSRRANTSRVGTNNERYYKLLEEQNAKLQSRVETLEGETRTLRDQKELMLIEERQKIEAIYKEKDEQLKNILSTLSSQFMLTSSQEEIETIETVDADVEVEMSDSPDVKTEPFKPSDTNIVSLKKYVKKLKVTEKKAKKIKARFEKKAQKDRRIMTLGDKIYLDTLRYDYSDLIKK
jgi:hypothetical protein